jgi:hypothetical protein
VINEIARSDDYNRREAKEEIERRIKNKMKGESRAKRRKG